MQSSMFFLLSLCVKSHDDGSLTAPLSGPGEDVEFRRAEFDFLGASGSSSVSGFPAKNEVVVPCALPEYRHGKYVCADQSRSLEERIAALAWMQPFDEVNGQRLDDIWPATASKPYAETMGWELEGISYRKYQITRPKGERSPIHIHENGQLTCLKKGKVKLFIEGQEDKILTAPDCVIMPPNTKMSSLSLEDKVEEEYFRFPEGGLDWIVLEPQYQDLQGQWAPVGTETAPSSQYQDQLQGHWAAPVGTDTPVDTSSRLGAAPTPSALCPRNECPMTTMEGGIYCVGAGATVGGDQIYPATTCPLTRDGYPGLAECRMVSPGNMHWICEGLMG